MANTFLLKIITPGHDVYNGEVEELILKNADGLVTILANHAKLITSTVPSIVKFKDAQGNVNDLFISTAIVNVSDNEVTISSDAAEFAKDIDFERAEEARGRAEGRLKDIDKYDKKRAQLALIRATERLRLKKSR
ncbi:ATP synthase F1 subunit epsilon [Clostridium saccharobutylicum]|uniref:ATP synthase epsilon chain n=1 Tax=Clostridium saccharobutylicum DSM 13864 TaxID=1345695 RepID=U5ML69_CLOSA|nr:ATP synthase F1 subunit epsilon [Clostridium saccharobutylicum]AGX41539.1 ATP synthase epsilon chain [Clostridium saccharobutylicum DSM 13864]AQR88820.1 ATP synthase epsilon chain [Clostridium saccharobutylicum]AQR98719.1 ATP synthase epsilon chain [Clostridium saccharobutylicum]AQS08441.1 ATP synthase epsilon chain [Clostridium saccharobutylicum]AQS12709.1 ATP synthase epsilon chain [Clostridium saccharobutylicum]